jgi:ubiquitin-protein ligase
MTDLDRAFRAERLLGDLEEMQRIRCAVIDWKSEGEPPHRYVVEYRLWSVLCDHSTRGTHRVLFDLGESYPDAAPTVVMVDAPPVFHPNVFQDGRICIAPQAWMAEEGLAFLVIRVAKMLLYFDLVTNPASPANQAAAAWYVANRSRFPLSPNVVLPDPITGICAERPRLVVRRVESR